MNSDVYFLRSRSKPSILLFETRNICPHLESLVDTMDCNLRCFIPSRLQLEDLKLLPFQNAGLMLEYFFLSPPLLPDRYFLHQILKTGAKLGQFFAIFRNSVYTHVGSSRRKNAVETFDHIG